MIDRRDIGRPSAPVFSDLYEDDSSCDDDSSGDESADDNRPRPPKYKRSRYSRIDTVRKKRRWRDRLRRLTSRINDPAEVARRRRRRDFVVFEYLENGDLAQLINKLVEAQLTATTNAARDETRVPNRVLWAFVSNFQSYPYPYLTWFGNTFLN